MATGVQVPEFVQDINVFAGGIGHLGVSDEVELPKIAFTREDISAGGFEKEVLVGTLEKMEAKITVNQYSTSIMEQATKQKEAYFVIKGSIKKGSAAVPAVATIKGDFDIEFGNLKAKEAVKQTLEIKVKFFEFEVNGEQLVQLDADNMIAKIYGVDYLAELRSNIQ